MDENWALKCEPEAYPGGIYSNAILWKGPKVQNDPKLNSDMFVLLFLSI